MMRTAAILLLTFGPLFMSAQLSVQARYSWLQVTEWDDVIRQFNDARPWMDKQLAPLSHGVTASLGWHIPLVKRQAFFMQPEIAWSRYSTRMREEWLTMQVMVQTFDFQLNFNSHPRAFFQDVFTGPIGTRWYWSIAPGITMFTARVRKDDEDLILEGEEPYAPQTFYPFLELGTGYRARMIKGRWVVTGLIRVRYYPTAEIEDFSRAVQGANISGLRDEAQHAWTFSAGLEFTRMFFRKSKG